MSRAEAGGEESREKDGCREEDRKDGEAVRDSAPPPENDSRSCPCRPVPAVYHKQMICFNE
jgi:hypothetical protein